MLTRLLPHQCLLSLGEIMCWSSFAMEDGGRFRAHALAFLRSLAEHAVSQGVFCAPDSFASLKPAMQVSLWVQRWQQRLSAWLHVSLSRQLLRLYQPSDSFDLVYS